MSRRNNRGLPLAKLPSPVSVMEPLRARPQALRRPRSGALRNWKAQQEQGSISLSKLVAFVCGGLALVTVALALLADLREPAEELVELLWSSYSSWRLQARADHGCPRF